MHYSPPISRLSVVSADTILKLVEAWPQEWRDHFDDRLSVLLLDDRYFCWTTAHREAAEDTIRTAGYERVVLPDLDGLRDGYARARERQ